MSDNQPVTELDFRKPEFRDAKPQDYERREDGAIVRKDRWEMGFRAIVEPLGGNLRKFEIPDVLEVFDKRMHEHKVLKAFAWGEPIAFRLIGAASAKWFEYTMGPHAQALFDDARYQWEVASTVVENGDEVIKKV